MVLTKLAENRRFKRHTVRLKVFYEETGELLGYAEDLHIEGMGIASKKVIPNETEIHLNLTTEDEQKQIPLRAFRIWSSFYDTLPIFYYSGLHFIDPSQQVLDDIQEIIDELTE